MTQLLVQNMPTKSFQRYPGQTYIGRDSVETLYHILNVKVIYHIYKTLLESCTAALQIQCALHK